MVVAGISGFGITLYPVLWVLMPKEGLIAGPMASAELNQRVEKVVGYPPLCDMDDFQRREFHEALLEADAFEDLPGKWQAAILKAERSRPRLRLVSDL